MSLCNCIYVYDPEYPCKVHPERKDYVQALERLARAAIAFEDCKAQWTKVPMPNDSDVEAYWEVRGDLADEWRAALAAVRKWV